MAGRFPGARDLRAFRRNLEDGVESITALTDDDLIRAGVDRRLLSNPNYVKAAPLLEDADQFDAGFFEYSPREATIMDPQQRLFLECSWEAIEDAGYAGAVAGTSTGVFSGAGGIMSTYLLSDTHFNPRLTGTTASMEHVGNDKDYLSTRVSYKLDLRGPSLTVQTACSTSLVAVHLACRSLLNGECDMALAGGTTVRVPHVAGHLFKEGNVFSRDGHCRAFDADAEGTVFGSGVGVVVLKRLHDAIRDNDAIHAVIRGTAINNDGSNKISYWAPHDEGQAVAMRKALSLADVDPATIRYVEAHGTATKRGDPTEVRALAKAFGATPGARCGIGSVKSNIGHPESAAGVAGLIKVVLMIEHGVLFPSLHYSRPNPEMDPEGAFYVVGARTPWAAESFPRRAAVNSLGIGGTNAFAIVEEAPQPAMLPAGTDRPWHVLPLSAKTPAALDALKERFKGYLDEAPSAPFADVCFTAGVGRAHFDHRLAVVAASAEDARTALGGVASGTLLAGHAKHGERPRVAFLFTGQGSQYAGMGRQLYETHPGFRQAFDRCAAVLAPHLDRSLHDVVFGDGSEQGSIDETAYTQPALFALEYALATVWQSWGVEPSVLIGHSVGEIAAACVAGVFSLEDGLRLVAARGRLMQALPRGGAMTAFRCDPARVTERIAAHRNAVSVAAINGPNEVVVSGRSEVVEALAAEFESQGVTVTRLQVSHAFHSPLMEPMLAEFARVARSIEYSAPRIQLISNLTGELATAEIATADYWVRHVMQPVVFADGIMAALAHANVLLEVGPRPVLIGMARQCAPDGARAWLPSLRSGRSDWQQMTETLAGLYVCGASIDWCGVHQGNPRRRTHLPTYPFQRQRYWMDPATSATGASQGTLLGQRLRLPGSSELRFETRWSPDGPPYLTDHRLFETVVIPGASHMAMALTALKEASRRPPYGLSDVIFPQALTLADDGSRTAQIVFNDWTGPEPSFQVLSLREGADEADLDSWATHGAGRVDRSDSAAPLSAPLADWQARCTRPTSGRDFYERFREAGYHLGPAFQWISRVWSGTDELLCELSWPDLPDDPETYPLYPSLIDACFQCVFGDKGQEVLNRDAVYVPFSVQRFTLVKSPQPGQRLWCHVRTSFDAVETEHKVDAEITVCDDAGSLLVRFEGCQLREVRRDALQPQSHKDLSEELYEVEWRPQPRAAAAKTAGTPLDPGVWLVFADGRSALADGLIERLRSRGQRVVRVDDGSYQRLSADSYRIDGSSSDEVQCLLDDVARSGQPLRGVVHLWSLDIAPMAESASRASRDRVGSSLLHLVQSLAQQDSADAPRLWVVTRGAQPVESWPASLAVEQAPAWGLGRVLALEHPELGCVRVDLDPFGRPDEVQQLFEDVWEPDGHDQLAYRGAARYAARLVRWPARKGAGEGGPLGPDPLQVRMKAYGQLDDLGLVPMMRRSPGPGEVEIRVRATGVNFRDVLNALGMLEAHYAQHLGITCAADMTFGFECAGTVVAIGEGVSRISVGQDVVAVAMHDALGSFATVRESFVAAKPAEVTFEEAATLPLAFLTAYYGLHALATLRSGERVLIHAAAGGVGLAAVRWAQQAGAEVFATASPAKWDYLRSIGVSHVMSSRSTDFAPAIMALTGGQGVDVVLNTLSGEFVDRSFDVLRQGGRFVELGKRGVWTIEEARTRRPDVAYFPFDLVEVSRQQPETIERLLGVLTEQLVSGQLAPLKHTVFPVTRVGDAFRYMAEARHIGKIVVSFPPPVVQADSAPVLCHADGSYLVTGGLGALGLEIAKSLVEHGAGALILAGRSRPTGEALAVVEGLRQSGARVLTVEADIADASHIFRLQAAVQESGRALRGVVHAAGVLDDGVILQQTWDRFRRVMAPKVDGTWNLHVMTRDLPLDFFVGFSSLTSLLGNPGQANYAAGNAFLDAMAHYRRARGLAAVSVNWGPWGDVGMAAVGDETRQRRLADQGFRPIPPGQGIEMFARLSRAGVAQVGVIPVSWPEYLRRHPAAALFLDQVGASPAPATTREVDVRLQLNGVADSRAVLADHVTTVVGTVLGMRDPHDIDPRARLFDLGLESLMAVELRGRFQKSLGCTLRSTLLFDYPTIESLVEHLLSRISTPAEPPAAAPPPEDSRQALAAEIAELGEEELAERLARELWTSTKSQIQ